MNTCCFPDAMYIQEPNLIYFDYSVFKKFAHPGMFADFTNYILTLIRQCIQIHGGFEMHMNLKSFSVTGAQRYSDMIRMFCSQCLNSDTEFSKLLTKIYLYNTPKVLGSVSAFFIGFVDDQVKSKIVFL